MRREIWFSATLFLDGALGVAHLLPLETLTSSVQEWRRPGRTAVTIRFAGFKRRLERKKKDRDQIELTSLSLSRYYGEMNISVICGDKYVPIKNKIIFKLCHCIKYT